MELMIRKDLCWFCSFESCGGPSEVCKVISAFLESHDTFSQDCNVEISAILGLFEAVLQMRKLQDQTFSANNLSKCFGMGLRFRLFAPACLKILLSFCHCGPLGLQQVIATLDWEGQAGDRLHPMSIIADRIKDSHDPETQLATLSLLHSILGGSPLPRRAALRALLHSHGVDDALRAAATARADDPVAAELVRLADEYSAGRERDAELAHGLDAAGRFGVVLARLQVLGQGPLADTLLQRLLNAPDCCLAQAVQASASAAAAAAGRGCAAPSLPSPRAGPDLRVDGPECDAATPPVLTTAPRASFSDSAVASAQGRAGSPPKAAPRTPSTVTVTGDGSAGPWVAYDPPGPELGASGPTSPPCAVNTFHSLPPPPSSSSPPPPPPPPPPGAAAAVTEAGGERRRRLHWHKIPPGALRGTLWASPAFQAARAQARALVEANRAVLLALFREDPPPQSVTMATRRPRGGAGRRGGGNVAAAAGAEVGRASAGAIGVIGARRAQLVEIVLLRLRRREGGEEALRRALRRSLLRLDGGGMSAEDVEAVRGCAPSREEAEALRSFIEGGGDPTDLGEGGRCLLELARIPMLARCVRGMRAGARARACVRAKSHVTRQLCGMPVDNTWEGRGVALSRPALPFRLSCVWVCCALSSPRNLDAPLLPSRLPACRFPPIAREPL
jgi:hypothetical protein